jgi:type I restriction enzyme R subunit
MDGNRAFHQLLTKGKTFTVRRDGGASKTVYVDLIDYENPEANRFHAVNQFSVSRETTIRPDVTLFVNGIPLVTMELKSKAQDNDYYDAISDLREYEEDVPRLFVPGLFNIAADTMELRYGAVGASREFYEPWNDAPPEYEDENGMRQAVRALCNPTTLLDVLKHFVFYERRAGGDAKIVPRYMQYYAVNEILDRVAKSVHKEGLIWHTQGSGKSFTMLYAAENLLSRDVADNPQVSSSWTPTNSTPKCGISCRTSPSNGGPKPRASTTYSNLSKTGRANSFSPPFRSSRMSSRTHRATTR